MDKILQRHSLTTLPDELILQVFQELEAYDVLSVSLVSRNLHQLSKHFAVWHRVFVDLLHRARYTDLLAIDREPLSNIKADELRKSVILAARAEKNWLRESPKTREPPQTFELETLIGADAPVDKNSYMTKFTSRHLLIPLEGGTIVGWNLKDNVTAGSFDLGPDSMLVDIALEKSTRALLGLVAKVAPVRVGDAFGIHTRIGAVRIKVPPEPDSQLSFERSKEMTLLLPFCSEAHLLDASRRMFCAVFSCIGSTQMALLVVFDWDTEETAIFNTGIQYDQGRSLIGVHLSPDGESIILASEDEGSEVRRWYSLANLRRSSAIWNAMEYESDIVATPTRKEVFKWVNETPVLLKVNGTKAYMFWTIDQLPEPPYPEIPTRVSSIVLYQSNPVAQLEEEADPEKTTWHVAQYYSDKDGPCAPSRSILTLRNAALSRSDDFMPIVCMSFNHLGWVEEVDVDGTNVRRLRLATFPDPGKVFDGDLADTASTLDIPSDVLDSAFHVLLDATQGLILVATERQTIHAYRY